MATKSSHKQSVEAVPPVVFKPVFGTFYSPSILYDENSPKRIYVSETSMLWALRKHREAFVAARAIGKHAGQIVVDPDRCAVVAETVALTLAGAAA
ncbi:MAG: hypothetical protein ABI790_11350 [Betaproteobacteria bacterium]